ncbi:MAG: glycosyltransferase family 2 protein, partial [Henriciella sp.]
MASGFLYGLIVVIWLRLLLVIGLGAFDVYARRQSRQTADPPYSPADITFVVPAYNESRTLPATLASIQEDIDAGASLIIVDDGSEDDTFDTTSAAVKAMPNGRVLRHSENLGKPDALNTALNAVETRFIVTVDADTRLCAGSTQAALAALHKAETIGEHPIAVAFDVAAAPTNVFFFELQRIEYDAALNFERRAQSVLGAISVCPGAAALWTSEGLRQINGFRDLTATEDVDATLRLAAKDLLTIHE